MRPRLALPRKLRPGERVAVLERLLIEPRAQRVAMLLGPHRATAQVRNRRKHRPSDGSGTPAVTSAAGGGLVSAVHRSQGSSVALLERLVLASFASPSGLTRRELEELTGLSRTVVAGVVASLVTRGELAETRQPPTGGGRGRPPTRYQRTALLPPVLLIQLRRDWSTSVSALCGDGTRSEALPCALWPGEWRAWSQSVLEAADQLRNWAQLPPRLAVLSAPFPVAEARRALRGRAVVSEALKAAGRRMPPRPAWLERDPRPALSGLLGSTTLMVNDANLAALGEAWFGAGRGRRAVFHISVVYGIGAGFVFDGRLFTGAHGFSGELAHVQVTPEGPLCVCGNRGCLITQPAVRCLRGRLADGAKAELADGDMAELGALVGRALAPLVTMLDPDCVVVDARLGEGCGAFIAGVTTEVERCCPPDLTGTLTVVAGELDDAERYGALAAADAHAAELASESAWPGFSPAVRARDSQRRFTGAPATVSPDQRYLSRNAITRCLRKNELASRTPAVLTIPRFGFKFPECPARYQYHEHVDIAFVS